MKIKDNVYPLSYLSALIIDSVGSGLWIPFVLLYFTQQRKIDLLTAGNALSLGALCAVVGGSFIAGSLVDKVGSFHASAWSSLVRGVIFPGYIFCEGFFSIFIVTTVISFADRIFWAAHTGMVESVGKTAKARINLFALLSALRSIGLGLGALLASLGVIFGERNSLFFTSIILVNAGSYIISGILLWRLRSLDSKNTHSVEETLITYRDILSQQKFLIFVCAAFVLALVSVAFDSILPIYLYAIHFPPWSPSAAYLGTCLLILVFSPWVAKIGHTVPGLKLLFFDACLLIVAYSLFTVTYLIEDKTIQILGIVFGVVLFSFAETIFGTIAVNLTLSFAPTGQSGRHSAVYQLFSWGLASTIGPGLCASLFSITPTAPWNFLILLLILAALIFLFLYHQSSKPLKSVTSS